MENIVGKRETKTGKVSFEGLRAGGNSLLESLILKCVSGKDASAESLLDRLRNKTFDPQSMDIKFSINEIEFPVVEIFQQFQTHLEDMAKEEAKNLVCEKFSELEDVIDELGSSVKEIASKRLGITFDTEEW